MAIAFTAVAQRRAVKIRLHRVGPFSLYSRKFVCYPHQLAKFAYFINNYSVRRRYATFWTILYVHSFSSHLNKTALSN